MPAPSVRKFARALGVPLDEVKGSGPKGRITQDDVQNFTKQVMSGAAQTKAQAAKAPAACYGTAGGRGLEPAALAQGRLRQVRPHRAQAPVAHPEDQRRQPAPQLGDDPHVTNNDEADITELEAFRVSTNKENEKSGVKVTMLAFVLKAWWPRSRSSRSSTPRSTAMTWCYKQYFHIGFAADTPNGLVVPVIRDADKKGIVQISQEMGELAKKARDGKLGAADMQGGCMSISSLGGIGGHHFTPIINAPEVAILGLSKSAMQPVWDGKGFQPRLMLPLCVSYDHRVIDGASAARFNAYLGQLLADFRRIVL